MNTARHKVIREALSHFEDWVRTDVHAPDLAPKAEQFICEYVILNAHDEAVRRMWNDYAHEAGVTSRED